MSNKGSPGRRKLARLISVSPSPSMDADLVKFLTETIVDTRIVSYVNAGSITILLYDFFLSLDREVETIWKGKLSYTKFMYILTRYSAFIEAGVVIYQLSIPGTWYAQCAFAFKLNAWLFVFGLGIGEIIMTIRTWAVWGKSRFMKFALPIFYVCTWSAGFAIIGIFLQSLKFDPNPLTPYLGCLATYTSSIIFSSWVLLLVYDAVMFILMLIPAFKAFRAGGTSRLMTVVLRDGVLYYLYLFIISLINILITLTFPVALLLVISLMSRVLHAILACRVVLEIHSLGQEQASQYGSSNYRRGTTQSKAHIVKHSVSLA
ncbi:hypothetical protein GALMADRAFT_244210 [Galerina marginata CBS 339.88]|uniref:DUF6533 domain-containing protein n=1 Tax=Galerina marginata (strain CBS 339.88) TaxID=685588 RepID=A0A067T679_GALM3|nr:hypothetical protein GALMADRAFT_244210 [Galerina marginata CBS 339.88]